MKKQAQNDLTRNLDEKKKDARKGNKSNQPVEVDLKRRVRILFDWKKEKMQLA